MNHITQDHTWLSSRHQGSRLVKQYILGVDVDGDSRPPNTISELCKPNSKINRQFCKPN